MAELNDDNPTIYKDNANLKGNADDSYDEFRRKGNFTREGNFI
jgi:hypothetical protein